MADNVTLIMCCAVDGEGNENRDPLVPESLDAATAMAARTGKRVIFRATFEKPVSLGFSLREASPVIVGQIRPGSNGQPGRCELLGVRPGDAIVQVNGTNVAERAEQYGVSEFESAKSLLSKAVFPIQVVFSR